MPYQTGIAISPNDFLQKIVAWLQTIGWTANMSQANGTGWRAHVSKNGMFANLCTTIGNVNPWAHTLATTIATTVGAVHLYVGDGYDAGLNWNAQPGGPKASGQTYNVGCTGRMHQGAINSYTFFSDQADNICIVYEGYPGFISYIGWGRLNKAGSYTGGEYFFGSTSGNQFPYASATSLGVGMHSYCPAAIIDGNTYSFFIKADVDSFTGKWLSGGGTVTTANYGYTGKRAVSSVRGAALEPPLDIASYIGVQNRATNEATMAATLLPVMLWCTRDAGGYSHLGDLPGIYYSNAAMENFLYPIGTTLQSGADLYVIYPNFAVKQV